MNEIYSIREFINVARNAALRFYLVVVLVAISQSADAAEKKGPNSAIAVSPDSRNSIVLEATPSESSVLKFSIARDGKQLFGPSSVGPKLSDGGDIGAHSHVIGIHSAEVSESFTLPWGKTRKVDNHCSSVIVDLKSDSGQSWQLEARAYDDGVAFRYRILEQDGSGEVNIAGEATKFDIVGNPNAIFDNLENFTTSHEALYSHKAMENIPSRKLMDMPLLLMWPNGPAAAITEGRVRDFAGMYLLRPSDDRNVFECRLSPLIGRKNVCVKAKPPIESPWRVVLLGESAGKLLESNLLLCLNDPPKGDFEWALPGKTSFPWWNADFEEDYKSDGETKVFVERNKQYIDFCAANGIAYHSVHGDGRAWYPQSSDSYGAASEDSDVRVARPEIDLPAIIAYAKSKGVGIRLWVHWKPLSKHLEEAFTNYEVWGIKGLMVDFLDHDDQEMLAFTDRMMESAARHKLHIQIHGSSKYSGEQRTWPNLFNREGVLNLEYLKWSNLCTPQHAVDVAYTRALAGPVDFHLGGFRSVPRAEFHFRDKLPVIMGTRCYSMALYVVYENPMPMVADTPSAYEGQPAFEFVREVPTTWDETRFVMGEPGEFIVLARRSGRDWYLAGITNWTGRQIDVPLTFLPAGKFKAKVFADGADAESNPNDVKIEEMVVDREHPLKCAMASGGGVAVILQPE